MSELPYSQALNCQTSLLAWTHQTREEMNLKISWKVLLCNNIFHFNLLT